MTQRQMAEAKAIKDELEPKENADGVSCVGPETLVWKFREYLQKRNIIVDIFDNVLATETLSFSEARLQVPLSTLQGIVKDFAIRLATQPEEDIPSHWGGTLPA